LAGVRACGRIDLAIAAALPLLLWAIGLGALSAA
jgi:hypothetical protein